MIRSVLIACLLFIIVFVVYYLKNSNCCCKCNNLGLKSVCFLRYMIYGLRFAVYGIRCMVYGIWFMVYGFTFFSHSPFLLISFSLLRLVSFFSFYFCLLYCILRHPDNYRDSMTHTRYIFSSFLFFLLSCILHPASFPFFPTNSDRTFGLCQVLPALDCLLPTAASLFLFISLSLLRLFVFFLFPFSFYLASCILFTVLY